MATVRLRAGEDISLTRTNGKVVGGICNACSGRKVLDSESILIIDCDSGELKLCKEHEGYLIEKLINNYIKRRARGSIIGFIDDLVKPVGEKPHA